MVGVINVRHESRLKGKIQKIYAHVVKVLLRRLNDVCCSRSRRNGLKTVSAVPSKCNGRK